MRDRTGASGPAERRHKTFTVEFGGVQRDVAVFTPSSYAPGTPMPLVIALHGGSGDASVMYAPDKRITAHAESDGFIAVFPNGLPKPDQPDSRNYFWGDPINIEYMAFLMDQLIERYTIDAERMYVIGFSGGAKLIYGLACDPVISARIAGIATVAGDIGSRQLEPPASPWDITDPSVTGGAPMPAFLVQGQRDDHMPLLGGFNDDRDKLLVGFETKVAIWRAFVGARAETPIRATLPADVSASAWSNPDSGHIVVAAVDATLAHNWPRWDLMAVLWDFFQHMPPRAARAAAPHLAHAE
jgi:polyhydroxybutyrate depolymerase